MKNTVKMSLAAALAVSALSTSASAGNLEEMIKGVTASGKMEVEYDYTSETPSGSSETTTNGWDYDLDIKFKSPVNDNVTAVVGLQADHGEDVNTAVANEIVDVSEVNFVYANGPVTAIVGKQGMAGAPWFDDEKANGVVAMYNAGAATVAAGHFTGNSSSVAAGALNNQDITAAAVIGSAGPVNGSIWYADITDIADSYSINVNASVEMVSLDVTYTDVDYENTDNDADLLKVVAAANLDVATVYAGYGVTGDHNADSAAGVDLTGDDDAAVNFGTEQLFIDDLNDAEAFLIGATAKVDAWKFDLSYVDGDYKDTATTKADFDETLLDVEYKMSKNLTIDAFYSWAELNNTDMDAASIALEYKF